MKNILLTGLACVAITAATAAYAQTAAPVPPASPAAPTPPNVRIMFNKTTTRADVQSHVQRMFAELDTNHDGYVTRDEANAAHERMMADMHARMAKGWDMDRGPAPDRAARFDKLDANHDGVISRQEYVSAQPQVFEKRVFVMRDDGKPGKAGMRMHGMGLGMMGPMFDMADANHDGKVSLQEATAAALKHFDTADLNHDGQLTPEERMQAHQRMRAERRHS